MVKRRAPEEEKKQPENDDLDFVMSQDSNGSDEQQAWVAPIVTWTARQKNAGWYKLLRIIMQVCSTLSLVKKVDKCPTIPAAMQKKKSQQEKKFLDVAQKQLNLEVCNFLAHYRPF